MEKQNENAAGYRYFLFIPMALLVFLFSACPDPFNVIDDAERDLDRPLPDILQIEQQSDPDDLDSRYNTQPVWTWSGDPEFGTVPPVFRFRKNDGEWTTVVMGPEDEAPYSYSVADDVDEEGNPRHLYPGTYLFEVQERNAAGNWSVSAQTTTVILVREPVFLSVPPQFTNIVTPSFTWRQWLSADEPRAPQFGASNTFVRRLERRVGGEWQPVAGETTTGGPGETSYTVGSPLTDGLYRFGIAEQNKGGERSAFTWTQFTVDTIPPNPPIHTTALRTVSSPTPTWTWTSGGPDGNGLYRWWLSSDGSVPVPGTTPPAGGPAAATSYTPDNGLSEGVHRLFVQERDAAGNWSAFGIFEISRVLGSVARWTFSGGNEVLDSSGNGNHLVQSGTQTSPGYSNEGNNALLLSANTHGFTVPQSSTLHTAAGGQTYSFWFRNNPVNQPFGGSFGQLGTILRRDRYEGENSTDRMIFTVTAISQPNRLEIVINNMLVSSVYLSYEEGGGLITNEWNLITVVFDYQNSRIRLYANGELEERNDRVTGLFGNTMQDEGVFYIGHYPNPEWPYPSNFINMDRSVLGQLDDVQVFDQVLTSSQIAALYTADRN